MTLNSEQTADLQALKQNLLEETHPFFKDEQLVYYLEIAEWDVDLASFNALVVKAQNDSITLPSGLSLPDNQNYWLSLAKRYRKCASGTVKRGDALCQ